MEAPAPDRATLAAFLAVLREMPPGPWTSNHWAQVQSYTGVVYPVVDARCTAMASATVQVVTRNEHDRMPTKLQKAMANAGRQESDEEWQPVVKDHDIRRIFEYPNPRQSISDIIYERTLQLCLTGMCHQWNVPDGYGEPSELYVIPTALATAMPAVPQWYPHGAWRVLPVTATGPYAVLPNQYGSAGAVIPAETVDTERNPHPYLTWDGYSPLQAASIQLDVLNMIDRARWAIGDKAIRPSGVAILPEETTMDEAIRFQQQLNDKFGGADQNGKILVTLGIKGLTPWGVTSSEMQGAETWDQMVKYVSALFRTPPAVSGLSATSSYAELYAAQKQYYTTTLIPDAHKLAQHWNRTLIWPTWGRDFRCQIDLPAIDDQEQLRAGLDQLIAGNAITVDELRIARGLRPFGDERGEAIAGAQPEPPVQRHVVSGNLMGKDDEPPRPDNPSGKGSLPSRIAPSLNGHAKSLATSHILKAEWDESKHPRADDGQFGPGGPGGVNEKTEEHRTQNENRQKREIAERKKEAHEMTVREYIRDQRRIAGYNDAAREQDFDTAAEELLRVAPNLKTALGNITLEQLTDRNHVEANKSDKALQQMAEDKRKPEVIRQAIKKYLKAREEFHYTLSHRYSTAHEQAVEDALRSGADVPQSVLDNYPDLAAKYGRAATKVLPPD